MTMGSSSNLFRRESQYRRLERLEAHPATLDDAAVPSLGPFRLAAMILAARRGALQPEEAVSDAYGRALGYANGREIRDVMQNNPEEWRRRHAEAWHELLEAEGVDPFDVTPADYERLYAPVPVETKTRLHLKYPQDAFL